LAHPYKQALSRCAAHSSEIARYNVLELSGEYYITKNLRVFGGISNLTDEKYYSRVFFNGSIEPAPRLSGYAGVSLRF
jgi:outer membrane receptor protein involved in Fe transport